MDPFISVVFIIGLFLGSFLLVLADRLPRGEDVLISRSHCERCGTVLSWHELIPVVSYLWQRGMCATCHTHLSISYPLAELATAVGLSLVYMTYGSSTLTFLLIAVMYCAFIVIFFADVQYQIIPDSMLVIITIAAAGLWVSNPNAYEIPARLGSAIVACLLFYGLWRGSAGRALGFGDVKFVFVEGLLLGFPGIVFGLYAAFISGALVGILLLVTGKKRMKSKIAFGPFLLFGMLLTIVFEEWFLQIWMGIFG